MRSASRRPRDWLIFALCASLVLSSTYTWARYARPELEQIPVARLIENLTKLAAANPKDAAPLLNLARACDGVLVENGDA
ncbi:MAG: hypothetical protein QM811_08175 [Pirellulales bacterium]